MYFFVYESTVYIGRIPDKNIGQSTEGVISESWIPYWESIVTVTAKSFQSSLLFMGKTEAYLCEVLVRCYTLG